jgi:hypothetical protein
MPNTVDVDYGTLEREALEVERCDATPGSEPPEDEAYGDASTGQLADAIVPLLHNSNTLDVVLEILETNPLLRGALNGLGMDDLRRRHSAVGSAAL